MTRTMRAALLIMGLVLAACDTAAGGSGGSSPSAGSATPAQASRPATPAHLEIVEPKPGATVTGANLHVVVAVQGARIVQATTTNVKPDEGHVHLFLDGTLVYMNYTLQQDIPVHPGTYQLRAEFVASDHFPFNPRATTATVVFTVR